jgi:DNA polymerase III subunit delta
MAELDLNGLLERLAKGNPIPAILLLGSDSFLKESCRNKIIETYVEDGTREWAIARFSAKDDPAGTVLGQAQMLPMLAPRQVIVWSEMEALERLGEESRKKVVEQIEAYLENPAPFTVLVLEAIQLDARMTLSKSLAAKTLVVTCELDGELPERIAQTVVLAEEIARGANVRIDRDAAQLLAEITDANLAAVRTEIEKLAMYVGERKVIHRNDVAAIAISDKRYDVWQLSEMLATGDRKRAMLFLESMLREGEQPVAMVGAIAWMFRKLIEVGELPRGMQEWDISRKLGMRANTAKLAIREAKRIPRKQLEAGLLELAEADSRLKSGNAGPRAIMEFLLARLTDPGSATPDRPGSPHQS